MNVQERIAKARTELEATEPITVKVEVGGEVTELSFRPLTGMGWADLTAAYPPRAGATLDQNIGYNLDAVVAAFPPQNVLVDGGPALVDGVNVYTEIVGVLASPHLKRIGEVLFHIQQMVPAQRLVELGKASAGVQKRKPRSPAK